MPVQHLPNTATADEVAAVLDRDGAAIVDQVVEPAVMERARTELAPYLDATRTGPDDFSGRQTRRTGGLVARSVTCRDLVMHPTVLGAVAKALSKATNFQLHLTQVIAIGPGQGGQQIHRDQWAYDFFKFPQGYEVQCNTIWAMTDFTEANGATRVVVGSNHWEDGLQLTEADTEPAEMTKGSVLFYTGSLYHGGGANRSDATRYGVNITYNVAWLRQEENQYLSVPLEIARTLPDELLRLIGYARGAYALGYVDDLRDPIEVVHPDRKDPGLGNLDEALANARARRAAG
jgi:ectoine hydroxylase-related dioxygenase (phytanoyl-CoA dioxygenase family)